MSDSPVRTETLPPATFTLWLFAQMLATLEELSPKVIVFAFGVGDTVREASPVNPLQTTVTFPS